MRRRDFVSLMAGTAIGFPLVARAQKSEVPVIGFLHPASAPEWVARVAAFRQGLADAGYTEGRNVTIEFRWAEGHYERVPVLAADLARRRVAVIVAAGGGVSVLAAKAATSTIPIVFTAGGDPVKLGLVDSLNRPGGNITGVSVLTVELAAKRLEVLHSLVPQVTVVGMLVNPNGIFTESEARNTLEAARQLNLQVSIQKARNKQEIDQAFSTFVRARTGALLIGADVFYELQREQLVALAAQHAVPTLYPIRAFVAAGGLASYGANFNDAYRQAGVYAGKILGGAKPADLPILQPSSVELVINAKTAKTLGLTIPQSLLLRADEVIQ
jgi:putative ABC transport system substrate-binding protein